MSTKGILKVITNYDLGGNDDTPVYPITSTLAVYDDTNTRLSDVISDLQHSYDREVLNLTNTANILAEKVYTLEEKVNGIINMDLNSYVRCNKIDDIVQSAEIISMSTISSSVEVVWVEDAHTFAARVYKDEKASYYNNWPNGFLYLIQDESLICVPNVKQLYTYENDLYAIKNGVLECIGSNFDFNNI